jgi:MFS family permease
MRRAPAGVRAPPAPSRGGARRLPRPFLALALASGASGFGDYASLVALGLFVFQHSGSATATGLAMAARLLSGLLATPLAGRLAAPPRRRSVVVGATAVQAAAMALLALAVGTGRLAFAAAFAAAVVSGAGATVATVALRASVPAMVGAERRADANSLLVGTRAVAAVAGFASVAAIVAAGGFAAVFAVDAATFALLAATAAWLPLPYREPVALDDATPPARARAPGRLATQRRRVAQLARDVLAMIGVRMLDAAGSGSHNVALPVYFGAAGATAATRTYAGFLTAWAAGSLVVSALVRRTRRRWLRQPGIAPFVAGTCLMSAMFVLAFAGVPPRLLLAIALVAGAADGFTAVAYATRIQAEPEQRRGDAFALSAAAESGGLGAGMLMATALLPLLGPLWTVAAMHGCAIVGALLALLAARRPAR